MRREEWRVVRRRRARWNEGGEEGVELREERRAETCRIPLRGRKTCT